MTEKIFQVIYPHPLKKTVPERRQGIENGGTNTRRKEVGVEGNEHKSDAASSRGLSEAHGRLELDLSGKDKSQSGALVPKSIPWQVKK